MEANSHIHRNDQTKHAKVMAYYVNLAAWFLKFLKTTLSYKKESKLGNYTVMHTTKPATLKLLYLLGITLRRLERTKAGLLTSAQAADWDFALADWQSTDCGSWPAIYTMDQCWPLWSCWKLSPVFCWNLAAVEFTFSAIWKILRLWNISLASLFVEKYIITRFWTPPDLTAWLPPTSTYKNYCHLYALSCTEKVEGHIY